MSDYDFSKTVEQYKDVIRHLASHCENGAEVTDFCDDDCLLATDEDCRVGDDLLSLEFRGDGEDAHIRALLAFGGPNVSLIRDWGGDSLVVDWWMDSAEWRDESVTTILDYLSEYNY